MNVVVAKICDKGGRQVNQDSAGVCSGDGRMCLAACDGLGAYAGSGEASNICVAHILRAFERYGGELTTDAVGAFFHGAYEEIMTAKAENASLGSSCTTAACVFANDKNALIAHIGDTRVYVFDQGNIAFRTTDHSVAQLEVEKGKIEAEEIRFHKHQNKLTRVVGGKFFVLPDVTTLSRAPRGGDAFLLCTDGFWEYVRESEMEYAVKEYADPADALAFLEKRLLEEADDGHDNYTAILAYVN